MMQKHELRQRIIRRLRKMRRELREDIAIRESWNDNRTDEVPFDVGWDKTMLHYVECQLAAWESGDHEEVNRAATRMNDLCEVAGDL